MTNTQPKFKYMFRFRPYTTNTKSVKVCLQINPLNKDDSCSSLDSIIEYMNKGEDCIQLKKFPCTYMYEFKTKSKLKEFIEKARTLLEDKQIVSNGIVDILGAFPSAEYATDCLTYLFLEDTSIMEVMNWLGYKDDYFGELPVHSTQKFCQDSNTDYQYMTQYFKDRIATINDELDVLANAITDALDRHNVQKSIRGIATPEYTDRTRDFQEMWM